MKKPKLYLVPGMGADRRVFEGLHRQGLEFEVLEFIPAQKSESLREYAHRLSKGIDQSQPFAIGGMSLGGMIATEIADVLPAKQLFLISTAARSKELPFYFRPFRYLRLPKLIPGTVLVKHGPKTNRKKMEPWQAKILDDMRMDASPEFVKWATMAVLDWRRKELPSSFLRWHGTNDWLLPGTFVEKAKKLENGSHVMVLTEYAALISEEIEAELQRLASIPQEAVGFEQAPS